MNRPKRQSIRIDDEPLVTLDYSQMGPRIQLSEESCRRLLKEYAAAPTKGAFDHVSLALDRYQKAYKRMIGIGMVLAKEHPEGEVLSDFLRHPSDESRKALLEKYEAYRGIEAPLLG